MDVAEAGTHALVIKLQQQKLSDLNSSDNLW
jgi:hypothetical protein